MNAYSILAALAIMACLAGWGSWEAGKVDKLQGQMDSLKASYATAAAQAKLDAQAQEQKDLANLQSQQATAISQANSGKINAEKELEVYKGKIEAASKAKDLPHLCAGVQIPEDLRP